MPWWAWVLIGWAAAAILAGLLLGAAARKARGRERRWRLHQYVTAPDEARRAGAQPPVSPQIPGQREAQVEEGEDEGPRLPS